MDAVCLVEKGGVEFAAEVTEEAGRWMILTDPWAVSGEGRSP